MNLRFLLSASWLAAALVGLTTLARPPDACAQSACPDTCRPAFGCGFHRYCPPPWNMEALGGSAATSMYQFLRAQTQNGEALAATLWNHHFAEGTATLQPSGLALLHRLARRAAHQPEFLVLIQTAHDLEFTPDAINSYARDVETLDAERIKAVQEYARLVLRRPELRVLVHDPAPVGMSAKEGTAVYEDMIGGATGRLRKSGDDFHGAGQAAEAESAPSQVEAAFQPAQAAAAPAATDAGQTAASEGADTGSPAEPAGAAVPATEEGATPPDTATPPGTPDANGTTPAHDGTS